LIHDVQAAAAGFVFLSLYINAQMKVMSDYRPAYWKQIFFFAPLLATGLIGGALTIDKYRESTRAFSSSLSSSCRLIFYLF